MSYSLITSIDFLYKSNHFTSPLSISFLLGFLSRYSLLKLKKSSIIFIVFLCVAMLLLCSDPMEKTKIRFNPYFNIFAIFVKNIKLDLNNKINHTYKNNNICYYHYINLSNANMVNIPQPQATINLGSLCIMLFVAIIANPIIEITITIKEK